jgi:hypothetical protein
VTPPRISIGNEEKSERRRIGNERKGKAESISRKPQSPSLVPWKISNSVSSTAK